MTIPSSYIRILTRMTAAVLFFVLLLSTPSSTLAATSNLEVSGWIPYWRTEAGTKDSSSHISKFTEVNPFGYSVRADGTLSDIMKLDQDAWQDLIEEAQDENVRVIPTIMWSDTNNIHAILTDPTRRAAHIRSIVSEVERNGFDGIDIDYEGKRAESRDGYSAFLRELSVELKKGSSPKWLQCTIEARMPLSSRYSGTPPANIEYANDLPKINQYCDRVRIMTYDQQTADIELNRQHQGVLYAPIADTAWVKKVINYMAQDIDKSKMMMGIATYGYIWQAMPKIDGTGYTYIKTETFNPRYGTETAAEYGITPVRGASGELGFSYVPKNTVSSLPSQNDLSRLAPSGTASALLAALGAIAYAKEESRQAPVTYLTWSDEGAIKQKITLANQLGIKGVSIFKIDGGVDPGLWNVLQSEAPKLTKAPGRTTASTPPASAPVTPVFSASRFTADLEFGMNSATVLELQKRLAASGHLQATPNGNFGPATRAAVITWQKANGISGTGYFGPLSRSKMNESAPAAPATGAQSTKEQLISQIAVLMAQVQALQAQLAARGN